MFRAVPASALTIIARRRAEFSPNIHSSLTLTRSDATMTPQRTGRSSSCLTRRIGAEVCLGTDSALISALIASTDHESSYGN